MQPSVEVGTVHVVLDVFFATPDEFYRSIDLFGDFHRLCDEIDLEAATKAATEHVIVYYNLFEGQPGQLCRDGLRSAHDLDAYPDLAGVLAHIHRAVDRLHGRMRQKRNLIDRFQFLRGGGQSPSDVAV